LTAAMCSTLLQPQALLRVELEEVRSLSVIKQEAFSPRRHRVLVYMRNASSGCRHCHDKLTVMLPHAAHLRTGHARLVSATQDPGYRLRTYIVGFSPLSRYSLCAETKAASLATPDGLHAALIQAILHH
jgi:hypothetical protein